MYERWNTIAPTARAQRKAISNAVVWVRVRVSHLVSPCFDSTLIPPPDTHLLMRQRLLDLFQRYHLPPWKSFSFLVPSIPDLYSRQNRVFSLIWVVYFDIFFQVTFNIIYLLQRKREHIHTIKKGIEWNRIFRYKKSLLLNKFLF